MVESSVRAVLATFAATQLVAALADVVPAKVALDTEAEQQQRADRDGRGNTALAIGAFRVAAEAGHTAAMHNLDVPCADRLDPPVLDAARH